MALTATHHYIKEAAELLGLSSRIMEMVTKPFRVVKTNLTIELDDGNIRTFQGYRVQHNQILGPMKGGIRYHLSATEEEVESLASLMTWKTALLRLPFGGAKGGIYCNPKTLSESELERLTKAYADKIKEIVGPYKDIPAPDINTNAQIMAWFMSEYSKHYGFTPAVVTGKPVILHGSQWREEATGAGLVIITKAFLKSHNRLIKDHKFVIQGFGNVGYHAAKFLYDEGGCIIAISEDYGGIYNGEGLDIPALHDYKQKTGKIIGFPGSTQISNESLLTLPCDILIPAALGDVFTAETAKEVNCRYIVEGANSPTLPEADEIFKKKDIVVIPDILANAGGVVVSYFEWVQNIQQFRWTLKKIQTELNNYLVDAYHRTEAFTQQKKCSFRQAAHILALGRVVKASVTLGL